MFTSLFCVLFVFTYREEWEKFAHLFYLLIIKMYSIEQKAAFYEIAQTAGQIRTCRGANSYTFSRAVIFFGTKISCYQAREKLRRLEPGLLLGWYFAALVHVVLKRFYLLVRLSKILVTRRRSIVRVKYKRLH